MTDLKRYRKIDLIALAGEFEVELNESDKITNIITKIQASPNYDLELAVAQIKFIQEDREKKEAEIKEQKECEERERVRLHELEVLKASQQNETTSLNSNREETSRSISIKSFMRPFDHEKSEISLFLTLFEKQAQKLKINEEDWTVQLLTLLPVKLAECVMKMPADKIDDYGAVKEHLLERFRVNAETYRTKFTQCPKSTTGLWKDLIFELRTYLNGWLSGLEINSFDKLKDLMITDQLKRRASSEMREKFLDSWSKFIDPDELAEKFDDFESVRKPHKKAFQNKGAEEKKWERYPKPEKNHDRLSSEKKITNWREKPSSDLRDREKIFEKRKVLTCFECQSSSHLRPSCPKLRNIHPVNNISGENGLEASFAPYLSTAIVNEHEFLLLRDTGSSVDLAPRKIISSKHLNGEILWVKQPLENDSRCLPVANIELKIPDVGIIKTKAAVVENSIEMNHYILGNETHKLIEQKKNEPYLINAVTTRSASRKTEAQTSGTPVESGGDLDPTAEVSDAGECVLPGPNADSPVNLIEVNQEQFKIEQRNDPTLAGLWEKAKLEGNAEYCEEKDLLFRVIKDHRGNERRQLIIPVKFRAKVLTLCHDSISSHVGINKVKDKLLRHFFWPHVIKDIEQFVKTCDPCQRISKKGTEVKKVPLKLVPIIPEIFTRINCDLVGPLPVSEKGNKYILSAICLASRYPEAIPLADIRSESVIDGLLIIFSRLGFPKEIQCDLGTCFTSVLTSTFFEKFGIKVIHSSVHHPQSHPIERWHRTVKRLLKVLCLENGESWEKNLPPALLALRTVTHDSTGFSPAELIHGRNLRTPEALLFDKWTDPVEEENLVTDYVFTLINRLKRCQELAIEKMESNREKRKIWYDKDAIARSFQTGDEVLVLATSKPNKLSVNWVGPGVIESKISDTNYIVNLPGRRQSSQIYHINLLKPYCKRVEYINVLMSERLSPEVLDADLDISYLSASHDVYDFEEIVRESKLEERCTPEQIEQLKQLLGRHKNIFSNNPGRTDLIEHDIKLITEQPFRLKPYRTSPRQTEILKQEIKRMLELKIIEVGESDFVSPLILVEVPGREPRPCIDYRKLNSLTRTEYFPLPNIEERVELVSAARFITLIDLTKGYYQIPMSSRAQRYATFATSFGTFRPLAMPFGLVNAPFLFSKFMSNLLAGCEQYCVPYMDDIAIFSNDWGKHMKHLNDILEKLKGAKLKIKPAKCKFAQNSVKYLGHVIGDGRRTPAEAKIKAVLDFPTPKTKTEIRRLLGLIGYYSQYLKGYATLVEPLTRALKGKIRKEGIEWTPEMEESFLAVKQKLTESPILYSPDYEREFIVQTDASDKGVGVVLAQEKNNEEHPILYLSRKFTGPEKNYSATEKECAAIIFAIKKLRPYLDGQKFKIQTDHNPLIWLKTNASNNQRLIRWALALQPYNYTVEHKSGKSITHTDSLSRM